MVAQSFKIKAKGHAVIVRIIWPYSKDLDLNLRNIFPKPDYKQTLCINKDYNCDFLNFELELKQVL